MKKLINSKYGKLFRKSFLEKIHTEIFLRKQLYCCHVKSWHSLFICWKDLKEVKENMNSNYLPSLIKKFPYLQNCKNFWFYDRFDRLKFLEECLNKFKNK